MKRRVALISQADRERAQIAGYFAAAGFDVQVYEELAVTSGFHAVVLLAADDPAAVRFALRAAKPQRILVVTSKPSAFDTLRAAHPDRLSVFAAPVFGWELVDALRLSEPPRPRGA
jgi:hypothetical protein